MNGRKRLGDILLEKGLIDKKKLDIALSNQKITGGLLGEILVKLGFVTPKEIAETIAEQAGLSYVDLDTIQPSVDLLRLFPKETAERIGAVPIYKEDGVVVVGFLDPFNLEAVDTVRRVFGEIKRVVVDGEAFSKVIQELYHFLENPVDEEIRNIALRAAREGGLPGPVSTRLVDLVITDGIRRKATDIHINPYEDVVYVFYRIDGVLNYAYSFPKSIQGTITSRIKILSGMDIAEQRLPQDGSFTFEFLGRGYDLRVSTSPTIYGENVVIRILSKSSFLFSLTKLGFSQGDLMKIKRIFSKPYGIVLITGPTGSGKTTTLYSALREMNLLERNVLTVEDPVEYRLSFVKQAQVNEKAGFTFALAGRNFMRQDPDVILLGEIRDEETAKIAIRASITGHLVLATLHANDAVSTIPRLMDFGVDRFLLGHSLIASISQRLVRKICPFCKEEYKPRKEELEYLGRSADKLFRGRGCERCNMSGYLGRTAIAEIMMVDDQVAELISEGASLFRIKKASMEAGMRPLKEDGAEKVLSGITTVSELMRVVG